LRFLNQIIKNGTIVGNSGIIQTSYLTVGRLPNCNISLEHPSISRFHAVFQFRPDNFCFIFDLGSSHGTFVNKQEVPKQKFVPLKVGDIVKFGASSRMYVLNGPTVPEPKKLLTNKNPEKKLELSW
jgi:pSer/pThr/pTyr-binding forkhead associated (FHA) protein